MGFLGRYLFCGLVFFCIWVVMCFVLLLSRFGGGGGEGCKILGFLDI